MVDLEALRRLIDMARRGCAPYRPHDVVLDGERAERILAALERAEEVADQGCEFCENAVDDLGEERDGGREPHAHWWACGRCWNASTEETSTVIGHLCDLLDRALERIPELERRLERAEQLETLARKLVQRGPQSAVWPEFFDLVTGHPDTWRQSVGRAAAPAEERS